MSSIIEPAQSKPKRTFLLPPRSFPTVSLLEKASIFEQFVVKWTLEVVALSQRLVFGKYGFVDRGETFMGAL